MKRKLGHDRRLPRPPGAARPVDRDPQGCRALSQVRQIEEGGSLAFAFAGGKPTRPVSKPLSDIPARLAWMDKQGIDKQVTGGWVDMFGYELPGAEAEAWARLTNELLARRPRPSRASCRSPPCRWRRRARRRRAQGRDGGRIPGAMIGTLAARRRQRARSRRPRPVLGSGRRDRRGDPHPSELRRRRRARERFRARQRARPRHRRHGRDGAPDLAPATSRATSKPSSSRRSAAPGCPLCSAA